MSQQTDPKPPTIEVLIERLSKTIGRIGAHRYHPWSEQEGRDCDGCLDKADADSAADALAASVMQTKAELDDVTVRSLTRFAELVRERDEARGEIAKQQTQIDEFARRMGADIEILKAENARLRGVLEAIVDSDRPCSLAKEALREGREGKG